jgi:hypothetical protein
MSVIRSIAYRNADALRWNGGRKENTGRNHANEQKFVFDHTLLIRVRTFRRMGFFRLIQD